MAKNNKKEPSSLGALVFTIILFLVIPLPLAFYFSGMQWLLNGFEDVPFEFIATYLIELFILITTVVIIKIKEKRRK